MSVFGLDVGTLLSKVAITRNGGVDVIMNEVSKRETSTYVSLTDQERMIGECGLDRSVRNFANTVNCIKHWIGKRITDLDLEDEKRFVFCNTSADDNGRVMFDVQYNNEQISLYPEQVLAMFLQQIRRYVNREATVDKAFPADVRDCVLSVPSYYTADQRRLVMQACDIAGINCMSLINETTASSIDYGIFRGTTLPEKEEDAQVVAIVDVGYGATSVSVSKFWKGNMKVLARQYDFAVSCREMDYVLYLHFAKLVQAKYKIDVTESKRSRVRMLQACDRLKQLLSANQLAPFNIENLMDVDVNIQAFERTQFEEIVAPIMQKLVDLCQRVLLEADTDADKLHSVEVIGGGCRIPVIKTTLLAAFNNRPLSFTLNATESASRGAAITAAVFSPKFQVREYVVNEISRYPVKLAYYDPCAEVVSSVPFLPSVNKVVSLLGHKDFYPKVLEVSLRHTSQFTVFAFYDGADEQVRSATQQFVIGEWLIGAPNKPTDGAVKIRVRFLPSGLVTLDGVFTTELYEVEETEEKKDPENPEKEAEKITVKKSKTRKLELTVTPNIGVLGHSSSTVLKCKKQEEAMMDRDVLLTRTKEAKNVLDSYILDNRPRVDGGVLAAYLGAKDQSDFLLLAQEYESWLYDDNGSDSTLEEYIKRTTRLRTVLDPAAARHRVHDDANFNLQKFLVKVKTFRDSATAKIGQSAWISEEELQGAIKKCDDASAWAQTAVDELLGSDKTVTSPFTFVHLHDKVKEVDAAVRAVTFKPQPKPPKKEEPPAPPPPPPTSNNTPGETSEPPPPTDLD